MKLTEYAEALTSGLDHGRTHGSDLPWRAAQMEYAHRERMLNERAALTATGWDALLTAIVGPAASSHDANRKEQTHPRENPRMPPGNRPNAAITSHLLHRLAYGQCNSGQSPTGPAQRRPDSWCNDSGIAVQ